MSFAGGLALLQPAKMAALGHLDQHPRRRLVQPTFSVVAGGRDDDAARAPKCVIDVRRL